MNVHVSWSTTVQGSWWSWSGDDSANVEITVEYKSQSQCQQYRNNACWKKRKSFHVSLLVGYTEWRAPVSSAATVVDSVSSGSASSPTSVSRFHGKRACPEAWSLDANVFQNSSNLCWKMKKYAAVSLICSFYFPPEKCADFQFGILQLFKRAEGNQSLRQSSTNPRVAGSSPSTGCSTGGQGGETAPLLWSLATPAAPPPPQLLCS